MKKQYRKYFFLLPTIFVCGGLFLHAISARPNISSVAKKDKIVADFNGDSKKEAVHHIRTDGEAGCISSVSFSNKNIEPKLDTGNFISFIRKEGNLDGIPGEEFSIYWGSCEASEWLSGSLYTIRNNQWKVHARFSVYGDPKTHDYVTKDPLESNTVILEENYWKGDSMAVRKKKIKLL